MIPAVNWSKGRFPNPSVIEFSVKPQSYAKLASHRLNHHAVKLLWKSLKKTGIERTHKLGFDVIYGPLATMPYVAQYKFESLTSQKLLNQSLTKKIRL